MGNRYHFQVIGMAKIDQFVVPLVQKKWDIDRVSDG
jgi:hypothetical protein